MAKSEFDLYNEGKTKKEVEYGIRYPDGTIVWDDRSFGGRYDISNAEGRAGTVTEFESSVKNLRVPTIGKLTFLRRTKTTKFSEPEELDG